MCGAAAPSDLAITRALWEFTIYDLRNLGRVYRTGTKWHSESRTGRIPCEITGSVNRPSKMANLPGLGTRLKLRQQSSRHRRPLEDQIANKTRGGVGRNQVGVNDEMVEQGIVDIPVEVLLEIPFPAKVFLPDEVGCLSTVDTLDMLLVLDAVLERGHQPNMQYARYVGRDDVRSASKDDDIPQLDQTQNSFRNLLDERPGRGVQSKKLIHDIVNLV